jgi:chaperonin GroEL (HSP60 family)
MTEPLSPAAQAVLDAVEDDCIHPTDLHHIAAAALRAAVDQLKYKLLDVEVVDCSQLLLLADELEA